MTALGVAGKADRVERPRCDPPARWDETTAWAVNEEDDNIVLQEYARIDCPDCEEQTHWACGVMACDYCESHRKLIG